MNEAVEEHDGVNFAPINKDRRQNFGTQNSAAYFIKIIGQ